MGRPASGKWRAEPRSEPDSGHPTVRDRRGALGDVTHGEPRNPTRKSKERLWSLLAYRCARPGSIPTTRTSGSVGGQGQQRPWSTRPRRPVAAPAARCAGPDGHARARGPVSAVRLTRRSGSFSREEREDGDDEPASIAARSGTRLKLSSPCTEKRSMRHHVYLVLPPAASRPRGQVEPVIVCQLVCTCEAARGDQQQHGRHPPGKRRQWLPQRPPPDGDQPDAGREPDRDREPQPGRRRQERHQSRTVRRPRHDVHRGGREQGGEAEGDSRSDDGDRGAEAARLSRRHRRPHALHDPLSRAIASGRITESSAAPPKGVLDELRHQMREYARHDRVLLREAELSKAAARPARARPT